MTLSDHAGEPPLIALPAGTKRIVNRAGHFVVLNPYAATKLKYWHIFMAQDGRLMARFNKNNEQPLEQFGAYTMIHLHPFNPESPPRLTIGNAEAG